MKIRGSATHVAEKYLQLARDAQASGDPVGAENYYQHAEHYFRMIAAAQEQFRQNQPAYRGDEARGDDSYDESDDDGATGEPGYGAYEPQPYLPRDGQPFPPRDTQAYPQQREQPSYPQREQPQYTRQNAAPVPNANAQGDVDQLPSFITGGAPQPTQVNGQNGHEGGQQPDRFPLHRRRRRHRSPRGEAAQGSDDAPPTND